MVSRLSCPPKPRQHHKDFFLFGGEGGEETDTVAGRLKSNQNLPDNNAELKQQEGARNNNVRPFPHPPPHPSPSPSPKASRVFIVSFRLRLRVSRTRWTLKGEGESRAPISHPALSTRTKSDVGFGVGKRKGSKATPPTPSPRSNSYLRRALWGISAKAPPPRHRSHPRRPPNGVRPSPQFPPSPSLSATPPSGRGEGGGERTKGQQVRSPPPGRRVRRDGEIALSAGPSRAPSAGQPALARRGWLLPWLLRLGASWARSSLQRETPGERGGGGAEIKLCARVAEEEQPPPTPRSPPSLPPPSRPSIRRLPASPLAGEGKGGPRGGPITGPWVPLLAPQEGFRTHSPRGSGLAPRVEMLSP